jgi:hypothetical protein
MSDPTPDPAHEPTPLDEAAAAAAANPPTYSPPTTSSDVPPAPAPSPAAPPVVTLPAPVTGPTAGRDARRGGVMGGVILILLGGIFLVGEFLPGIDIGRLWPLILVAIGIGIILRRR